MTCAADERAVAEGCVVDERAGEYVCWFFERFLTHFQGEWAGQAFRLLDWQRWQLIMPLFSWKRPNGTRRFREAYWSTGKKNGKTAIVAGLALYGLTGDGEAAPGVFSAACSRKQASYVYDFAANAVRQCEHLRGLIKCVDSYKLIECAKNNGQYYSLASDAASNEGLNGSMVIADEVHVWDASGRRLWNALSRSGKARRQPLLIVITTAGDDINGIGHDIYAKAVRIKTSELDQTALHVCIHEADPKAALDDPKAWAAANPSLGVTPKVEDIAVEAEAAIKNPEDENTFRRYVLNQWVTSHMRWLSSADWGVCDAGEFDIDELKGRPCCVGLDLGMVDASSALVAAFPIGDERMALYGHYFLPEDGIEEKELHDQAPYRRWADLGYYTLTPGKTTEYEFIKATIRQWCKTYKVAEIAYDPFNAYELAPALVADKVPMVEFPQGWKFISPASKEFARLVRGGKVLSNHDPVLRWMAGNVEVKIDASGNIRPTKGGSKLYIDGIIAGLMACARALVVKPKVSVYMTRGALVLGGKQDAKPVANKA